MKYEIVISDNLKFSYWLTGDFQSKSYCRRIYYMDNPNTNSIFDESIIVAKKYRENTWWILTLGFQFIRELYAKTYPNQLNSFQNELDAMNHVDQFLYKLQKLKVFL